MAETSEAKKEPVSHVFVRQKDEGGLLLSFRNVSLDLPQGEKRLVTDFSLDLKAGDSMILTGASGTGKTSIVRAFRDVWRRGSGEITLSGDSDKLCFRALRSALNPTSAKFTKVIADYAELLSTLTDPQKDVVKEHMIRKVAESSTNLLPDDMKEFAHIAMRNYLARQFVEKFMSQAQEQVGKKEFGTGYLGSLHKSFVEKTNGWSLKSLSNDICENILYESLAKARPVEPNPLNDRYKSLLQRGADMDPHSPTRAYIVRSARSLREDLEKIEPEFEVESQALNMLETVLQWVEGIDQRSILKRELIDDCRDLLRYMEENAPPPAAVVSSPKPSDPKVLVLSQKGFLPRLNLRSALSCPEPDKHFTDEQVEQAMRDAGMEDYLKHLPHKRAMPETLYDMGSIYLQSAVKHWQKDISRLADSQVRTLGKLVARKIMDSAENFLPPELHEYMTPQSRRKLGHLFAKGFVEIIRKDVERDEYGINYMDDQSRLAGKISQYLLQGMALEHRISSFDGKTLGRRLSGGQMQRMFFAQALLHKPDILIMDEITASLDKDAGKDLYRKIMDQLPNSIIISIAHNTHIIEDHKLHAHLENQRITVTPITPAPPQP